MSTTKTRWNVDLADPDVSLEELVQAARKAFPGIPLKDIIVESGAGHNGNQILVIEKHREPTPT